MNYTQALHFRLVEMDADEDDSRSFATQPKGLGPSDKVLTQESGKMVFLVSLLDNLKAEGHRCLVFSQSRKMLDIVQRVITHRVGRKNCCACFLQFSFLEPRCGYSSQKKTGIHSIFKVFYILFFCFQFLFHFALIRGHVNQI